jgi:hypothetical protein
MTKMGISIYPDLETQQIWIDYLELAAHYGFTRIFESLLQVEQLEKRADHP